MKVSAINSIPRVHFQGESSKKANGVKSAAGAAVIALAALAPAEDAKAQYYMPVPPPPVHYYVPAAPVMNIPRCFIVGDETNEDYEKTMGDVFNEIDREIDENGQISVNEVVSIEENNWNSSNYYPMTRAQKVRTANLVKNLSRRYNEQGSNPNTISYREYQSIMNDYMISKNTADFINLMQMFAAPRCYPHYHPPVPPMPPHHHHRY